MVIKPLLPVPPPEFGEASSLRTLPFRGEPNFLELLKAATQGKVAAAAAPATHEVQSGESLWRICENAMKTTGTAPARTDINAAVHRIAVANKLKDPDRLAVGQTLDLAALRGVATGPAAQRHSMIEKPGVAAGTVDRMTAKQTKSVGPQAANLEIARAPLGLLGRAMQGPVGGGSPIQRPLFHRLSNARPQLHAHPHKAAAAGDGAAPARSVDLAALMQSILEPGSEAPDARAATGPWSKLLASAGRFTSGFGVRSDPFSGKRQFHQGIDIAAAAGTEIYPYMPGTVKSAGWDPGHGKMVIVEHPNGMETIYAHASETLVKAGDIVLTDTPIAKVGSTGRSTGPHLHFEVRQNDKAINPLPLITNDSLNIAKAL